jgi:hypothetical protein
MPRILLFVCAGLACSPRARVSSTAPPAPDAASAPADAAPFVPPTPTDDGGFGFVAPDGPQADAPGAQAPSAMSNCGIKKVDLERHPADLLLVMDRSGSMAQTIVPTGGTVPVKKWDEVIGALDVTLMKTQGLVNWGLHLFPVGGVCNVPDKVTVPVAAANQMAVMAAIRGNQPFLDGGATPTQAAIRKATAILQQSMSKNPRYLVLATDGLPNCAPGMAGSDMPTDRMGTVQSIADALTAGIPTFVIGIATAGDADDTLNEMATAGGRPRMDATRYYPVASRDQLQAALTAIAGEVATCNFPLEPPPPVPDNVAVDLDGVRLHRDATQTDGWTYSPDGKTLILVGTACQRLMDGSAKNVQILYGCPDVIIP